MGKAQQTQQQHTKQVIIMTGLNIATAEKEKFACNQPDNKIKNTNKMDAKTQLQAKER